MWRELSTGLEMGSIQKTSFVHNPEDGEHGEHDLVNKNSSNYSLTYMGFLTDELNLMGV